MKGTINLPLFLAAIACLPALLAHSLDQIPLSNVAFVFRNATADDAGDIATVTIDAFSTAPYWDYLHQFQDKYPGYAWQCARDVYKSVLEDDSPDAYVFKVIAVPDRTARSGSRVVSFSVWDFNRTGMPDSTFASLMFGGTGNCSQRLDTNTTRVDHYYKSILESEKKYLDAVFKHQVYVGGLATHPQWDGHGFAKTHLDWGMEIADNLGLPTTLTGTEAGHPLYKSVGFEDLHNTTIERLDGKGIIWHEVMKYSGAD
ncbi:hypothetical protein PFICI_15232 [Pestalotiopsis fici W106-1]|uniref:N-acetyltransferase domain-containing protein n=1 Tax=Pestalotiopsis fici (strain W106-1 / CGMCC3.15140) TaxID=1229662 RepID=W3WIR7_PESFW|nr:uncharacterized protein PFICI_15232 [Pestalotiopsis fici W106-1]ETS73057.1 hypothetical protein PFICI_15232 [Pestalotiopsis fici W106-1]